MCILKVAGLTIESGTGRSNAATKPTPGNTRKSKNPVLLLNNVNVGIREKKITVLIGESGAGKTIFARAISALLPGNVCITKGKFLYKDKEVDQHWLKKVRGREIFYSPQNAAASFNPVIKIEKQITEAAQIPKNSLLEILKFLNIEETKKLLNAYPFELSEGENQRALLTMAIALKPSLLILDEPTSALDTDSQHDFMKLIKQIQINYSLNILLITHNLSLIRNAADYIYIILKGEIVAQGEPGNIFRHPSHPYTKEIARYLMK